MSNKLSDRISSYEDIHDYKLLPKLPIIFIINGKSFTKTTNLLTKPYCDKFAECMLQTMYQCCIELEGTFFAYYYNDEIILVSRNDQTEDTEPFFSNKLQKLVSYASSVATYNFSYYADKIDLKLSAKPFFYTNVFTVPTLYEAINTIISKQQKNIYLSIQFACYYELLKSHHKNEIKQLIANLDLQQKIDMLKIDCDVDFKNYNSIYRLGAACYKNPREIGDSLKYKWIVDKELPIFSKEQTFLSNIFKFGHGL